LVAAGRSLAADRRKNAKTVVKKGEGESWRLAPWKGEEKEALLSRLFGR
jgi:hypothetical protein